MNNLFYKSLRFDMSYINLSVPYMQCCGGWKEENNRVHLGVTAESREILTSIRIIDINGAANI